MPETTAPVSRLSIEALEALAHNVQTHKIDEENELTTGYYIDAVGHAKDAYLVYKNAENDKKIVEAQIWLSVKKQVNEELTKIDAKERGAFKPSEKDRQSLVDADPKMIAARTKRNEAEAHLKRCEGLMFGMKDRGYRVQALTDLVQNKFLAFSKS